MSRTLKTAVIFEAITIVVLVFLLINPNYLKNTGKTVLDAQKERIGLLSPRIYAGILEPKSRLIENFVPLKKEIKKEIIKNENISIYIENLRNGASIGIKERTGFFPASLNKIPLAILVMKKIEKNELSFDTMLEIKDQDRVNSFGGLYKSQEKQLPVQVLLEKMLKESDNTAFSVLRRQIEQEEVQFIQDYSDYASEDLIVNSQSNTSEGELISAKSMYNTFSSLYLSTLLEPKDSEHILSLLTDTIFDVKKIADLPENVTVAQKFGEAEYKGSKYFHTCGIIYIDRSRIFYCILTKDLDEKQAASKIALILNKTYWYVIKTRSELASYDD